MGYICTSTLIFNAMKKMIFKLLITLLLGVAFSGCKSDLESGYCSNSPAYNASIQVVDAQTGADLIASGAIKKVFLDGVDDMPITEVPKYFIRVQAIANNKDATFEGITYTKTHRLSLDDKTFDLNFEVFTKDTRCNPISYVKSLSVEGAEVIRGEEGWQYILKITWPPKE